MGRLIVNGLNHHSQVATDYAKMRYDKVQNNSYTRFMENAPIFVTWYKQSRVETTTDKGMGNVNTNIGSESSKRFVKIKHIPIYGIDKSSFNLDLEDIGLKGSYHTEGNMIMDCLEPIVEDYFTIEYQDGKYLFKITNVEIDSIESNNYYKISIKYDREYDPVLEKQVVDNFTCIFENIGSEDKSIIKDDDIEILEKYNEIYLHVLDSYYNTFHNLPSSSFIYEDKVNNKFIYDPYLMEFIIRNELFVIKNSLESFSYRHTLATPKDFLMRYKKSIFYNIEKGDDFNIEIRHTKIGDTLSYYYATGLPYYTTELYHSHNVDAKDLYYESHTSFNYKYNGDDIVFNTILKYLNINNKTIEIPNINNELNDYLADDDDTIIPDKEPDVSIVPDEEFAKISLHDFILNNFIDFYCLDNRDYFICVPLVLFIIKKLMNNININTIK